MLPLLAAALVSAATACGDTAPSTADLSDLTEEYGCGYGAQAGNADQSVALQVYPAAGIEWPPSPGAFRFGAGSDWVGEMRFGDDLFGNWCDDVVEPGEPTPDVQHTWTVTDGRGVLSVADGGTVATFTLTGLVAVDEDGVEHPLGDITVENVAWGMFAG